MRDGWNYSRCLRVFILPDAIARKVLQHDYAPDHVYVEVLYQDLPACWVKVNPRDPDFSFCFRCHTNRCKGTQRAISEVLLRELNAENEQASTTQPLARAA